MGPPNDGGGPRLADRLVVRTAPIEDPGDLLAQLPFPSALAWTRRGEGLVGWGEAARVTIPAGEDRFTAGRKWLRELLDGADVRDDVARPGCGPVAFGSFTFDPASDGSILVVPQVVIGRRGGRAWRTTIGSVSGPEPDPARPVPVTAAGEIRWHDGSLTAPAWERAVAAAVRRINAGELRKVVLARDLHAAASQSIDARALLARLAARYPDCYTFSCAGLVGATPELLVRRDGPEVSSLVLAGTTPRGSGRAEDGALGAALLASVKDQEEHRYAVADVRAALAPLCGPLHVDDWPWLLRLANVQHLATRLNGRLTGPGGPNGSGGLNGGRGGLNGGRGGLNGGRGGRGGLNGGPPADPGGQPAAAAAGPEPSALALAAVLHPTAAVCGTPAEVAMELIRELEGMDRGRYAGPVGWVDGHGNGEWGIALRCAALAGPRAQLIAGCGIVAGSDPAAELAEAQAKFRPIQEALEG